MQLKWEYLRLEVHLRGKGENISVYVDSMDERKDGIDSKEDLEAYLYDLGQDGWELVSTYWVKVGNSMGNEIHYFKRLDEDTLDNFSRILDLLIYGDR